MVRVALRLLLAGLFLGGLSECQSAWSQLRPASATGGSPTIATVQINPWATTQPISPNFMSIAQDLSETKDVVGKSTSNMNPIYEQLIHNLVMYQNEPMLIRMLSDADNSDNRYSSEFLGPLYQLHRHFGVQFFVGVDFKDFDTNPSIAPQEAAILVKCLPGDALKGIEAGNEPDLWPGHSRPKGWDYNDYVKEYNELTQSIGTLDEVKLAAPVFSSGQRESAFMDNLGDFITSEKSTLSMVVIHHYSGTGTEPADYLLSQLAVCGDRQPMSGPGGEGCPSGTDVRAYVPTAQEVALPLRIGELNSINNRGQDGVSNSFSSALWAMDISFAYAQAGVSGVNFFTPNNALTHWYSAFDFTHTDDDGGMRTYNVGHINPLYYGMLMFVRAVQNSAALLPIAFTTNSNHNIKAWATIDSGGTIRLLLLNKDLKASGNVVVSLSGYGNAIITRLTAPSYRSTTGLTLGGQTFDGTRDGTLQGTPTWEAVSPAGDVYTIPLPHVGAALVEFWANIEADGSHIATTPATIAVQAGEPSMIRKEPNLYKSLGQQP
jgi:hypothetical protein